MTAHKFPAASIFLLLTLATSAQQANAGTISFQQGVGGYTDVVEAYISTDFAGTNPAGSFMGVFHASSTSREDQSLLRFGNIFGSGAGQIPLTANITSATLTLTLTGQTFDTSGGTTAIHQLSQNWTIANDWSSTLWGGNGVQNDGVEALVAADDTGTWLVSGGSTDFTVLSSLRSWQGGAGNFGWLLRDQSDSNDRAFISTS